MAVVNESGANVYSTSDLGREEFPNLDITVRGAISIARRLQDPLAELVKVDPRSIGVGQYQYDVNQTLLRKKLAEVVESCVPPRVGLVLKLSMANLSKAPFVRTRCRSPVSSGSQSMSTFLSSG